MQMPKQEPSGWQTEALRLTAFTRDPVEADTVPLWHDLTGEDPEVSQARPREHSTTEAGPYLEGWLALGVATTRIDWRLVVNPNEPPDGLPTIGRFDELRDTFRSLMHKWLKKSPPLNRLAFGAVLLLPVDSRQEGYRRLNGLLPSIAIDAENSSDFSYKINRRRPSTSGIENLEINRLSGWSVSRFTGIGFEMAVDEPTRSRAHELGEPMWACRLEVDVNSAPQFRPRLTKRALQTLLDELVGLGAEIAAEGDIP